MEAVRVQGRTAVQPIRRRCPGSATPTRSPTPSSCSWTPKM